MTESETYEVPIELAGIIYIYNPPDVAKLGAAPADAAAAPAAGHRPCRCSTSSRCPSRPAAEPRLGFRQRRANAEHVEQSTRRR